MDAHAAENLTAEQALARIADVARVQSSLRSRFEGMTWILWGLVAALQATTLGFLDQAALLEKAGTRHVLDAASHVWILVGVVASVGIWRAAAVNFDPGISRRRAMLFFVAFPTLFALSSFGHTALGGRALSFAVVTALLLAAFAAANPIRFTSRGRWTAAVLAVLAAGVAATVWTLDLSGFTSFAVAGALIGLSWVVAGLDALFRA